ADPVRRVEARRAAPAHHLYADAVEPGVPARHVCAGQFAAVVGERFSAAARGVAGDGVDRARGLGGDRGGTCDDVLAELAGRSRRYILNTPNLVSGTGALSAAENASASTRRVSLGAMMPSSHSRALAKYGLPSISNCSRSGCLNSSSSTSDHLPTPASTLSRLTVASTLAACSPPMTEIRALGQVNRKRGP